MKYYICLLKKFNNYFNRIIKGFATYSEYITAVGEGNYYLYTSEVNYNPADNVSTELIMNDCPFDADYLLYLDDNGAIVSRWFILETVKTRNGQFRHSLRRDVIYEYHQELMTSPVFVQKGMLRDSDPFILNSEGMNFNEIKTKETFLKDKTGCSWIIVYLAKNAAPNKVEVQNVPENVISVPLSDIAAEINVSEGELASILNFEAQTTPAYFTNKVEIRFGEGIPPIPMYVRNRLYFNADLSEKKGFERNVKIYWAHPLYSSLTLDQDTAIQNAIVANGSAIYAAMPTYTSRKYFTMQQLEILRSYNNKTILYNGLYYTFNVEERAYQQDPIIGPADYANYPAIATAINSVPGLSPNSGGEISIITESVECYLNMKDYAATTVTPDVSLDISSTRNTLQDQSFDIIALSNGPVYIDNSYNLSPNALKIAEKLALDLDTQVYDVQLMPYCPMPEILDSDGHIDLNLLTEHYDYDLIISSGPFSKRHNIADNEWTITNNLDGTISASFTWTGAKPLLSTVVNTGYNAEDTSNISSVTTTLSGSDLSITLTATSADDLYAAKVYLFLNYTIAGMTAAEGIALYPKSASFSVFLDKTLNLTDSLKIESQCNKYRLVSPNYQGIFEFNIAKNGGKVSNFMADCTYKPYTPYIKVSPFFSYLYGANFGDNRGLICGGDFSLPRFNSAWNNYQLNNKNYQNIFNREIQNLDFEQGIAMRNQIVSGAVGALTGAGSGAATGALASKSWQGAVAGAAIGGTASAVGAIIDLDTLARRQREEKNLAIDKFNFQLGNIKALPYTLTKVGSFDINSKIWPFLEFYTCTQEEKEALENKILYESMTVMRIDYFGSYWQAFETKRYFKGELIRNEEIAEDNHIFEAIYAELLKGVYI